MSDATIFQRFFNDKDQIAKVARLQDLGQFVKEFREKNGGAAAAKSLTAAYSAEVAKRAKTSKQNVEDRISLIRAGLKLGRYLKLIGHLLEAEVALETAYKLRKKSDGSDVTELALCVATEIICTANQAYDVALATNYVERGEALLSSTSHVMRDAELSFRAEKASFLLDSGKYEQAYSLIYSVLRSMTESSLSSYSCIEVLTHATKICRRHIQFEMAGNLLQAGAKMAAEVFDRSSVVTSFAFSEMPWLIHDADFHKSAISAQKTLLERREKELGQDNVLVAVAYTDLACFYYMVESEDGKFTESNRSADLALSIFERPGVNEAKFNVLKARALRQKAIVTRSIANSNEDESQRITRMNEALQLALKSKELCLASVGELHFQSAACFSLLGDMFAAMQRLDEAEKMHLKATKLLGSALGQNHQNYANALNNLACMYNYQLQQCDKAEPLYKKVITIYRETIGTGCTNLQYPYRGLIFLYNTAGKPQLAAEYEKLLSDWQASQSSKENDKKELKKLTSLLQSDLSSAMNSKDALESFVNNAAKPLFKEKEAQKQ